MPPPVRTAYVVVDNFLPDDLAAAMRRDIDEHFATPRAQRAATHQVWNYWYVPDLYTYLRTMPEKIIQSARIDEFMERLKAWTIRTCGMGEVTRPFMSLYVPGCRQSLHNDSRNGRFAYVYSLTRDQRRTMGGETIVYHEADQFRGKLTEASAGRGFYDQVEPKFNRLVIFDDRMPHAVERIEGSMDPVEGRFVMHGHIGESGPIVNGPLSQQAIGAPLVAMIQTAVADPDLAGHQGAAALRVIVNANGGVDSCVVMMDRVKHPDPGNREWEPWLERLVSHVKAVRFPAAATASEIIQPVILGGALSKK